MINLAKSIFGVPELDFLGHHVDATGIHPLEEKVRVIREFPQPATAQAAGVSGPGEFLPPLHPPLCHRSSTSQCPSQALQQIIRAVGVG